MSASSAADRICITRRKTTPGCRRVRRHRRVWSGRKQGRGSGNKFLSHIREVDAIVPLSAASTTRTSFTSRLGRSGARHRDHQSRSSFLRTSNIWNAVWSARARRQGKQEAAARRRHSGKAQGTSRGGARPPAPLRGLRRGRGCRPRRKRSDLLSAKEGHLCGQHGRGRLYRQRQGK